MYGNNSLKYLEKDWGVFWSDSEPGLCRWEDTIYTPTNTHTLCLSLSFQIWLQGEIILSAQDWKPDSAVGVTAAVSRMDVWLAHCCSLLKAAALYSWIMAAEAQRSPAEVWAEVCGACVTPVCRVISNSNCHDEKEERKQQRKLKNTEEEVPVFYSSLIFMHGKYTVLCDPWEVFLMAARLVKYSKSHNLSLPHNWHSKWGMDYKPLSADKQCTVPSGGRIGILSSVHHSKILCSNAAKSLQPLCVNLLCWVDCLCREDLTTERNTDSVMRWISFQWCSQWGPTVQTYLDNWKETIHVLSPPPYSMFICRSIKEALVKWEVAVRV